MYSVFTKVLTEPSAVDILRKYANPTDRTRFGDAQSIYQEIVDHFEGGAIQRVTIISIDTKLTNMRLNRDWSKTVLAFVNEVSKLIKDHRELTSNSNGDDYYIAKVKATFSEHKDMQQLIGAMETQESLMERRFQAALSSAGGFAGLPTMGYDAFMFEIKQFAIDLDARYAKSQAKRRANKAEKKKKEDDAKKNGGGNRNGGNRGGDRNNNGGRTNGGGQRGGRDSRGPGYISQEDWLKMSYDERQRIFRERERARSANNANTTTDDASTIAGPPTSIQVQNTNQNQQQPATQNNNATQRPAPGAMVRHMMSNASQRSTTQADDEFTINGSTYRRVNNLRYRVHQRSQDVVAGSLVDGGANGGLLGDDVLILEYVDGAKVDVTGIADSEVSDLKIAQAAGLVETVDGPVILIMSQYAVLGSGKTIHSKGQMEHFGIVIDDRSRRNGGAQCMVTTEGYVVPISIRDGLPRIDMRPPSQAELDKYPHVFVTSDSPWDPAILDEEFDETFHDAVMELPVVVERQAQRDPRVDECGFLRRTQQDYALLFEAQDAFIEANSSPVADDVFYDASSTGVLVTSSAPGHCFFGWSPDWT